MESIMGAICRFKEPIDFKSFNMEAQELFTWIRSLTWVELRKEKITNFLLRSEIKDFIKITEQEEI